MPLTPDNLAAQNLFNNIETHGIDLMFAYGQLPELTQTDADVMFTKFSIIREFNNWFQAKLTELAGHGN